MMKAREWSEIVAGPRWKTFIRRFRKRGGGRQGKFQYDPLSYALNFDEGHGQDGNLEEAEYGSRDFSARFVTAKSTGVISERIQTTSPPLLAMAVDS